MKKYYPALGILLAWLITRIPAIANGMSVNMSTVMSGTASQRFPFEFYLRSFEVGNYSVEYSFIIGLLCLGAIYYLIFRFPSRFAIAVAILIPTLSLIQEIIPSIIPGRPGLIDSGTVGLWAYYLNPAGSIFSQLEILPELNLYGITTLVLIVLTVFLAVRAVNVSLRK